MANQFLSNLHETRAQKGELIDATLTRAADEGRDITDIELANIQALKLEIDKLDARIEQITEIEVRKAKAQELAAVVDGDTVETRAAAPARVISEEPTYHERGNNDFLADAIAAEFGGSYEARERIARYQRESMEKRDSGSSNFAGLVIPQYLVSEFAGLRRPGRPVLDISTNAALPASGMTVNIGRLTTGVTSYVQASENTAPTESSPDDTLLTVNVRTYAGMVDVSRQALERGTGVEAILAADLISAYNSAVNADAINGDGTAGTHLGILNTSGIGDVDADDATPTGYETFQKIIKAIGTVTAARYKSPDIIIMHPRRWAYICGSLDSSNRPLAGVTVATSTNIVALGNPGAYGVAAGEIAGIPVVTDAGIPTNLGAGTNEDNVIVACREDLLLWEQAGSPLMVRYDQVGSGTLTVRMVAFGYSAFTAGRYPGGIAKCQGTLFSATL